VRVIDPETPAKVALIVQVPTATPVARPLLSIVATDGLLEVQVTCLVMSPVLPTIFPVAVNWSVSPTPMLGLAAVTFIEDIELSREEVPPPQARRAEKNIKTITNHNHNPRFIAPSFLKYDRNRMTYYRHCYEMLLY
jgi:hypothetical protein